MHTATTQDAQAGELQGPTGSLSTRMADCRGACFAINLQRGRTATPAIEGMDSSWCRACPSNRQDGRQANNAPMAADAKAAASSMLGEALVAELVFTFVAVWLAAAHTRIISVMSFFS